MSAWRRVSRTLTALVVFGGGMLVAFVLGGGDVTHATVGKHPDSLVPGSEEAAIFSPIGRKVGAVNLSIARVRNTAEDHHYTIKHAIFTDDTEVDAGGVRPTDNDPGLATAANFLKLSKKGLVFVATHNFSSGLLVEAYGDAATRDRRLAGYTPKPFAAGELIACNFDDHTRTRAFGICITPQGIGRHFEDNNSIVHLFACCSVGLASAFNAREFFAYDGLVDPQDRGFVRDTNFLWGRMHGEVDDGINRAASVAYAAGGFTAGFRYIPKVPRTLETVLSPAVKLHEPPKDATLMVSPNPYDGFVTFDALMDAKIAPAKIISIKGCKAVIRADPDWSSFFTFKFKLFINEPGEAELRVAWHKALGFRFREKEQGLDGNTMAVTGAKDHVGPNEDDYVWRVKCVPTGTTTSPTTTGSTTTPTTTTPTTTTPTTTTTTTTTSTTTGTTTTQP